MKDTLADRLRAATAAGYTVPTGIASVSQETFTYPAGTRAGTELRSRRFLLRTVTGDYGTARLVAAVGFAVITAYMVVVAAPTFMVVTAAIFLGLAALSLIPVMVRAWLVRDHTAHALSHRHTVALMQSLAHSRQDSTNRRNK